MRKRKIPPKPVKFGFEYDVPVREQRGRLDTHVVTDRELTMPASESIRGEDCAVQLRRKPFTIKLTPSNRRSARHSGRILSVHGN